MRNDGVAEESNFTELWKLFSAMESEKEAFSRRSYIVFAFFTLDEFILMTFVFGITFVM